MSFSILQVVTQKVGHHHQTERTTIIQKSCKGPAANEADWKETLKMDLSKIKYEVADMKKKKGVQKKISKVDKFSMASLQPACHTKKFSCEYFLSVEVAYDGCVCCVDLPDAKLKMTIVPMVNPEHLGISAKDDFNPTELGYFDVEVVNEPSSSD